MNDQVIGAINEYNMMTVVLCVKDRGPDRIRKCFQSLKDQTEPCKVILVDFGSSEINQYSEQRLCTEFGFIYIETLRDVDDFNKSRALNIGLKQATSKYVISSDIDMIFAPNFIKTIKQVFDKKPKSIVLCQKIDLDKEGKEVEMHEPSASGSCIAIESDWIDKVHGYDEYYTYWGREDNDLVDRAIQDGYEVVWITDKTKMWHQWHEFATKRSLDKNDWYYKQPDKPIIRNPNGWGKI